MRTKILDDNWKIWALAIAITLAPGLGATVFERIVGPSRGHIELLVTPLAESDESSLELPEADPARSGAGQPLTPEPNPTKVRTEAQQSIAVPPPALPSHEEVVQRMREFLASGNQDAGSVSEEATVDAFPEEPLEDQDDDEP